MGMGGRSGGKGLEQSQIEFCVWLKKECRLPDGEMKKEDLIQLLFTAFDAGRNNRLRGAIVKKEKLNENP